VLRRPAISESRRCSDEDGTVGRFLFVENTTYIDRKNKPASRDFVIRPYRDGDEIMINEMFNEVFGQKRELNHWYWKYRNNPQGSSIISLALTSDGILAAHYAAYPLKLHYSLSEKDEPNKFIIYHAGDKMTRRQFRSVGFGKRALLSRTYTHFKDTATQPNTLYKFGFMAHHSLRFGLLFFNYTIIEPVPFRTLAWENLSQHRYPFVEKFLKGITVEVVSEIDETWTDFFSRTALYYTVLVRRDAAYLKWRYLQRPDRKYLIIALRRRSKLAGWSVFYREGTKIIWGDALFERGDLDAVKSVLTYIRSHPLGQGVNVIECWFPPRPAWWDTILQRLGFRVEVEPNDLHFCIGNFTDREAPEMAKKYLYYTMADSDLF
jgi:hypothetical protein